MTTVIQQQQEQQQHSFNGQQQQQQQFISCCYNNGDYLITSSADVTLSGTITLSVVTGMLPRLSRLCPATDVYDLAPVRLPPVTRDNDARFNRQYSTTTQVYSEQPRYTVGVSSFLTAHQHKDKISSLLIKHVMRTLLQIECSNKTESITQNKM